MRIPCLTLHAHWAHAIFHLGKDIENRTWSTDYRGPLAIHAGSVKRLDPKICLQLGIDPNKVICGHILGVVDLVDVVRDSDSTWAIPGMKHWVITNPRILTRPKPHLGQQTLHSVRVTL